MLKYSSTTKSLTLFILLDLTCNHPDPDPDPDPDNGNLDPRTNDWLEQEGGKK